MRSVTSPVLHVKVQSGLRFANPWLSTKLSQSGIGDAREHADADGVMSISERTNAAVREVTTGTIDFVYPMTRSCFPSDLVLAVRTPAKR